MTVRYSAFFSSRQHVHEGAVVDAVHAQRADEVALQHPEGLGQQQRVGRLLRQPDRRPRARTRRASRASNCVLGHGVLGARRDRAALPGERVPEPLDVAACERHGRVEADDREAPGHREDRLDDRLAHLGIEVVELRGVVPRERRAVVAVVDEALLAAPAVLPLEHDGGVGAVEVVVLEVDADALVVRQVRAR